MKLHLVLLCSLLLLAGLAIAQTPNATANWPQFRGPNGNAVASETNLPTEWSATENIVWKTAIAGRGHSSPVIWGNRIFLTSDLEGEVIPNQKAIAHVRNDKPWIHPDSTSGDKRHTLKVICLDRDSGKVLWERVAHEGAVLDDRHRKNTYASGTPVTDGRYVYAFFEAEGVYCYDLNGKLIWKSALGKISKVGMGPGTSPVLYENLLYLQCDNEDGGPQLSFLVALDKRTGKEVWRAVRDHRKTHSTPAIVRAGNRMELIASGWETVVAYDPLTGKELWQCEGVKGYAIPSIVSGHDMVFPSSGYPNKRVLGIKLGEAGKVVWSYDKGTAYVASPILYGEYLYLISDKGILTCLDAKTGAIKYEGGRVPTPESFSASPLAFDGKLLLLSEDGDGFLIKAGPVHEVLKVNALDEPIYASPAVANGRLFIRGDKHLYCIGKKG
jgi:outer membrane protein assembly factor BamB